MPYLRILTIQIRADSQNINNELPTGPWLMRLDPAPVDVATGRISDTDTLGKYIHWSSSPWSEWAFQNYSGNWFWKEGEKNLSIWLLGATGEKGERVFTSLTNCIKINYWLNNPDFSCHCECFIISDTLYSIREEETLSISFQKLINRIRDWLQI